MAFFHCSAEEPAGAMDCQGILAGWVYLKGRRATSSFLVGPGKIAAFVQCLLLNHRQNIVAPLLVYFQLGSNKDYSEGSKAAFVCHL